MLHPSSSPRRLTSADLLFLVLTLFAIATTHVVNACGSHSECSGDTYCDKYGECYECPACTRYDDAFDGSCPDKCSAVSYSWYRVTEPANGTSISAETSTLTVRWETVPGTGSLPEYVNVYLMRPGTQNVLVSVGRSVEASEGSVTYSMSSCFQPGRFYILIASNGSPPNIVGSGPGDLGSYLDPNNVFYIARTGCTAHSDCTGYCSAANTCEVCEQCQTQRDAIDGSCPLGCGGRTLAPGQAVPAEDETSVVGPVRTAPGCGMQAGTIQTVNDPNVVYDTANARRMITRLSTRLGRLAAMVAEQAADGMDFAIGTKLRVLRAYEEAPQGTTVATTHHEGRGADVTLTGTFTSEQLGFLGNLAVGAGLDWVFFQPATASEAAHIHVSVVPDTCQSPIDLVLLLDASGSIDNEVYCGRVDTFDTKVKAFFKSMVSYFNVGLNETRVGSVTFSSDVRVDFDLDAYSDKASLLTAIDNIAYMNQGTKTARGLRAIREEVLTADGGMRGAGEGISKVVVVITDGQANRGDEPAEEAALLHAAGVNVFSIGVGVRTETQRQELNDMASDPDNVYVLSSFNEIAAIVDKMGATTCDAPAVVDTGASVANVIGECEVKYFRPACGAVNNAIVEVETDLGEVNLYVSKTDTHPGPFSYDQVAVGSDRVKRLKVSGSDGGRLYVSVLGVAPTSRFRLSVSADIFDGLSTASVTVRENLKAGTLVYEAPPVSALATSTFNPRLVYRIDSGNEDGAFVISQSSGRITLAKSLDREARREHVLRVSAKDTSLSCVTGLLTVNVTVGDVDDTAPRFLDLPPYRASVEETAQIGHLVLTVRATDADVSNTITYSFVDGGGRRRRRRSLSSKFAIDATTGRIVVSGPLDAESGASFSGKVRATDSGSPPMSAEALVTITVESVPCSDTTWSNSGTAPCLPHKVCAPGEWRVASGTPTRDTNCRAVSTCNYDTHYRVALATESSDTVCKPLTLCESKTQVEIVQPTTVSDRECAAAQCPSGYFSATGTYPGCTMWSICAADEEYLVTQGTSTSDAKCRAVTTCDYTSQYRSSEATATQDAECSDLTVCPPGHDEVAAPTQTSDRSCADLNCPNGQWSTKGKQPCQPHKVCDSKTEVVREAGTATTDTLCVPAPCPSGQWSQSGLHPCQLHTTCNTELETVGSVGSATADTICKPRPCPSGTWSASGVRPCAPHTVCALPESVQVTEGTATLDSVCAAAPCAQGSWSNKGTYPCAAWRTCNPETEIEATAPTRTSDRVCSSSGCPSGTWSLTGKIPCNPHSSCDVASGAEVVATPGTADADTVCAPAPCATNTWSPLGTYPCTQYSTCGSLEVEATAPTTSSDRVCVAAPCAEGTWSSTGRQPCRPHTVCSLPASKLVQKGTATYDNECAPVPCQPGQTFSSKATGVWPCSPCTDCGKGHYTASPCTLSADAKCGKTSPPCGDGYYQAAEPTSTSDRICLRVTICNEGQLLVRNATATSDAKCQEIDDCAGSPCKNGGTCVDGTNKYSCQCLKGYLAPDCAIFDACALDPCGLDAECTNTLDGAVCGTSGCQNDRHCACCDVPLDEECPEGAGNNNICLTADEAVFNAAVDTTPGASADDGVAGIAGGVAGGLMFLLLLVLVAALLIKRREAQHKELEVLALSGPINPLFVSPASSLGQGEFNRVVAFDTLLTNRRPLIQTNAQLSNGFRALSLDTPQDSDMPLLRKTCRSLLAGVASEPGSTHVEPGADAIAAGFLGAAVPDWLVELAINHVLQGKSDDEPLYEAVGPASSRRGLYGDDYVAPRSLAEDLGLYVDPVTSGSSSDYETVADAHAREYATCNPEISGDESMYSLAHQQHNQESHYSMAAQGSSSANAGNTETYNLAQTTEPIYNVAASGAGDGAGAGGASGANMYGLAQGSSSNNENMYGLARATDPVYDAAASTRVASASNARGDNAYGLATGARSSSKNTYGLATGSHGEPVYSLGGFGDGGAGEASTDGEAMYGLAQGGEPLYSMAEKTSRSAQSSKRSLASGSSAPVYARGNATAYDQSSGSNINSDPIYDHATLQAGMASANASVLVTMNQTERQPPTYEVGNVGGEASTDEPVYTAASEGDVSVRTAHPDITYDFGNTAGGEASTDHPVYDTPASVAVNADYERAAQEGGDTGTFVAGSGSSGLPASVLAGSSSLPQDYFPSDATMARATKVLSFALEDTEGANLYHAAMASATAAAGGHDYEAADSSTLSTGPEYMETGDNAAVYDTPADGAPVYDSPVSSTLGRPVPAPRPHPVPAPRSKPKAEAPIEEEALIRSRSRRNSLV